AGTMVEFLTRGTGPSTAGARRLIREPRAEVYYLARKGLTCCPGGRPMNARRGRILVVDDEPMVGSSIRRLLGRDHDVVVVQSGKEAVAKIAAGERYDVVLCDLLMPEMTGMDVYADFKSRDPDLARQIG